MFSKKKIMPSTETYSDQIAQIKEKLNNADAVIIGAGSGLSASAGLTYSGTRFTQLFPDYIEHYGFTDMYSAAFYEHETPEQFWAYMSRHIYHNRYVQVLNDTYQRLFDLVKDKNYFVITTNVDHLFQKTGFAKERLFYTQGDYGLFQCSTPCHSETYDNEENILQMIEQQASFKIPNKLIPHCPKCGKPMTTNLRKDSTFVEDSGWHNAMEHYASFLNEYSSKKIVFLELGVGFNTPSIIKYPFGKMTYRNYNATFVSINATEAVCAKEITSQSILIEQDIHTVLADIITVQKQ